MTRFIIILLVINKCLYVTTNSVTATKNIVETSTSSLNSDPPAIDKISDKKKNNIKTSDVNKSKVYLEDVLYGLKLQDWADDEIPCLNRTLFLLQNLQNFTLWAVWDWDSISSQPLGLLYGSQYHLGNFDECVNTPWREAYSELRSQYCLADIVLERTDNSGKKMQLDRSNPYQSALNYIDNISAFDRFSNKLTWGICVPDVCGAKSVEKLTEILLARTHLSTAGLRPRITVTDECQLSNTIKPHDGPLYGFVGLVASLTAIALICTLIKGNRQDQSNRLTKKIIAAFDIRDNAANLLKVSGAEAQVFYGVKFLSMAVIVMGHQCGMFNGGPISNGVQLDEDAFNIFGTLLLHDDIVVDSFFMLSGFLTAATITKMETINPIVLFIKRYFRLIVAYALVTFFVAAVYPYIGSGPLWNRAIAGETVQCRKNWWINLLMLSNYIDSENICIIIGWYIPSDFHFFVGTTLLYWLYRRYPRPGAVLAAIITVAAISMPGIFTYINNFPPIQSFSFNFITNPRASMQFRTVYMQSHMRYAAYIVGFVSGYLFSRRRFVQNLKKISQKWLTFITYMSIIGMIGSMLLGTLLFRRDYGQVVNAMYAALNRPVWALGLSLVVLCCSVSYIPLVKSFLSWYPWVPLSRLTYGLYLIHSFLITRNVFVTRNLQHNDYFILLTSTIGIIAWSCLGAFVIWLIAEAPINNLITICFTHRKEDRKNAMVNTPKENVYIQDNQGYLEDNMPQTVQVISSKI